MKQITQQEQAAMWLYHVEYSKSALGVVEFYKSLSQFQRDNIDQMIRDICETPKTPTPARKKGKSK